MKHSIRVGGKKSSSALSSPRKIKPQREAAAPPENHLWVLCTQPDSHPEKCLWGCCSHTRAKHGLARTKLCCIPLSPSSSSFTKSCPCPFWPVSQQHKQWAGGLCWHGQQGLIQAKGDSRATGSTKCRQGSGNPVQSLFFFLFQHSSAWLQFSEEQIGTFIGHSFLLQPAAA